MTIENGLSCLHPTCAARIPSSCRANPSSVHSCPPPVLQLVGIEFHARRWSARSDTPYPARLSEWAVDNIRAWHESGRATFEFAAKRPASSHRKYLANRAPDDTAGY